MFNLENKVLQEIIIAASNFNAGWDDEQIIWYCA